MTTYQNILVETKGRVGIIRLNRPNALNALNTQLHRDLTDALRVSATTVVRVRWRSSPSVPCCTVRPARRMLTRSQSASTSARMWLESSTVRPATAYSRTHSVNTASISGSSPEVGSSSSSSSTSEASAATSATVCRLPLL